MSTQTVKPDVFISYSRVDIDKMRQIRDQLNVGGLDLWTDETLEPGTQNWIDSIQRALDQNPCLLVLMSPDAKKSEWVKREIEYASVLGLRIFPVLLRGSKRDAVPLPLITAQYADFTTGFEKPFQQIQKSIHTYLKKPIHKPEPPKPDPTQKETSTASTDELPMIGQQLVFEPPSAALLRFQRFAPFVLFIVLAFIIRTFYSGSNMDNIVANVLTGAPITGLLALGLALVILSGGIDLSVGGIVGTSSVVAAMVSQGSQQSTLLILGASLLVGTIIGLLQGGIIARLRMGTRLQLTASPVAGLVPSLLVTLFTFYLLQYVPLLLSSGNQLRLEDDFLISIGNRTNSFLGIPILTWIFILAAVIGHIVLTRTRIGAIFALIRSDPYSAAKQGLPVQRIILLAFMTTGMVAAFAGLLQAARFRSSSPFVTGLELAALGAFLLGGNSLFVNRGNLLRLIVGAINVSLISIATSIVNLASGWNNIILLILIALFVVIDYLTIPQARAVSAKGAATKS